MLNSRLWRAPKGLHILPRSMRFATKLHNEDSPLQQPMISSLTAGASNAELASYLWIKRVVLGLRLCPWAGKVLMSSEAIDILQPKSPSTGINTSSLRVREIFVPDTPSKKKKNALKSGTDAEVDFDPEAVLTAILSEVLPEIDALADSVQAIQKQPNQNDKSESSMVQPILRTETQATRQTHSSSSSFEVYNPSSTEYKTTVLVLTHNAIVHDFELFLHLVQLVEDSLEASGHAALVQVATFHPLYEFAGEEETEGVDNAAAYTNRSPYPMLHLLRVDDVSSAIDGFNSAYYKNQDKNQKKDARFVPTDSIWQRNIETLRTLGAKHMQQLVQTCLNDAEQMTQSRTVIASVTHQQDAK